MPNILNGFMTGSQLVWTPPPRDLGLSQEQKKILSEQDKERKAAEKAAKKAAKARKLEAKKEKARRTMIVRESSGSQGGFLGWGRYYAADWNIGPAKKKKGLFAFLKRDSEGKEDYAVR